MSRLKRTLKKIIKPLAWLLLVILVLTVAVLLIVQLPFGKDIILDRLLVTINESIEGTVDAERLRGNLFTNLVLEGVTVHDGRGRLAARVPRIESRHSTADLARGRLTIHELRIVDPLIIARIYEDGTLNFATMVEDEVEETAPSDFQIYLHDIALRGGLVIYADESLLGGAAQAFQAQHIGDLAALLDREDLPRLELTQIRERVGAILDAAAAQAPPDEAPSPPVMAMLDGIEAQAAASVLGDQRVRVDLERLLANLHIDSREPVFALESTNLHLDIDPGFIRAEHEVLNFGPDTGWRGVEARLAFQTTTDTLGNRTAESISQGVINFDEVNVSRDLLEILMPELPLQAGATASGRVGIADQNLWIHGDLRPRDAPGNMRLAGSIELPATANEALVYRIGVRASELHPEQYYAFEGPPMALGATLVIDGRGTDPDQMVFDARLHVADATIDEYAIETIYVAMSYDRGHIVARPFGILTPYLDVFGSGLFDPAGEFSVQVRTTADSEQSARTLPQAPVRPGQADLHVDLTGAFDPEIGALVDSLQNVRLASNWDFSGFEAEDLRISQSTGSVDATLTRTGPVDNPVYEAVYELRAQGRGIRAQDARLASFSVRSRGQGAMTMPIDDPLAALRRLTTDTTLSASGVRLDDLVVDDTQLRARVARSPQRSDTFDFGLGGTVGGVSVAGSQVALFSPDLAGSVRVDPDRAGIEVVRHLTLRGESGISGLQTDEASVEQLRLGIDLAGAPLDLRGALNLRAQDVRAADRHFGSAEVELQLAGQREVEFSAQFAFAEDPTQHYMAQLAGQYAADLKGAIVTSLALGTDQATWRLGEPGRITVRVEPQGPRVDFDSVRLQRDEQFISLDGSAALVGDQNLALTVHRLNLEAIREEFHLQEVLPEIEGVVDAELRLRGTSRRPNLQATVAVEELHFEGNGPITTSFNLDYADQRLTIEGLSLAVFSNPVLEGSMDLPVVVDFHNPPRVLWEQHFRVNLVAVPTNLEDFHAALPILEEYGATGTVSGHARVSGTLTRPEADIGFQSEDLSFRGEIGDDFIDLQDVSMLAEVLYSPPRAKSGGLRATVNIQRQEEQIFSLVASSPLPFARWLNDIATGQGLPELNDDILRTPFDLSMQVPDLDLRTIPLQSFRDADAAGRLSLDITATGTYADPRANITASLSTFGWHRFRDMYINVDATLDDYLLELERVRFRWDADDIFLAQGTIPLPVNALLQGDAIDDLPADFSIQLLEIPVAKLSAIDYEFARIHGSIAGYITTSGTLRNPTFRARVGLFNTELGDGRPGTVTLDLRGENNVVTGVARLCREFDEVLRADARLPINLNAIALAAGASPLAPGELRIKIEPTELNLAQVLPNRLIQQVVSDPSGLLAIDLDVRGTWAQPIPEGNLRLTNVAFTLPQYGRRLEKIETRVSLDEERLRVHSLSVADGPSSIAALGHITYTGLSPERLAFNAKTRDFNIGGFVTDYPIFVSSEIRAQGDLAADPSVIDVNIQRLNVILTDAQARDLHATELHDDIIIVGETARRMGRDRRDMGDIIATADQRPGNVNMQVNVVVERPSWIRHPNGDVEVRANVTATIVDGRVSMAGQGHASRGTFEFVGRRFDVQESLVTFTGAVPPNPQLQIEATHPLDRAITAAIGPPTEGEPRIIIRVLGTANNPRLELSSDPAMSDTEILFVLVTGRPPDRNDIGQDEGVASQALAAASGLFFGMLQDQLAGTVPVDVLRLEAGERGFRGGRLEVGKYITSNVFMSYRHQFGVEEHEAAHIIRIEYHFLPRWLFEALYTDQNEGELNIYWDLY